MNKTSHDMKELTTKLYVLVGLILMLLVGKAGIASAQSRTDNLYVQNKIPEQHKKNVMVPLSKVLEKIGHTRHITFVYQSDLIEGMKVSQKVLTSADLANKIGKLLAENGLTYLKQAKGIYVIKRLPMFRGMTQLVAASQVTGTVTDASTGETLPGVNIAVKGTTTGTATDVQGQYELTVQSLQDTLLFSFVGYQTQQEPIDGRTEIDVEMQSKTFIGKEMVVTALGISTERNATSYATTEVQGEKIHKSIKTNLVNSLSGRMAGVDVRQNTTGPGGSSRVIIRGNTSLSGNNQPLYVVDGMPINNTKLSKQDPYQNTNVAGDRGDGISQINQNDIKSITVLKGGQATALYGSEASNGVILITTKKGSAREGIGIEFNSNTIFERISKYPDWQYQYGQGDHHSRPKTPEESRSVGRLSFGEPIDGETYIGINGERLYSPVTVKENFNNFYRTGLQSTNSLAFSGGAENYNYRVSLSNLDAKSIMPNSSYNRKTVRLDLNTDVNDRLTIGTDVQYDLVNGINRPKGGYATYNANWGVVLLANTMDIRDLSPGYLNSDEPKEMLWNSSSAATNPYWLINRYHNEDNENHFIGKLNLTLDVAENLTLQGYVGQDRRNLDGSYIIPTGTAYQPKGAYNSTNRDIIETDAQATLNYKKTFLKYFNLAALAGGKINKLVDEQNELSGEQFVVPYFYSYSNLETTLNNRDDLEQATNSLFGSAEVNYKSIIYLTVTGRQDWFSTLNLNNNSIFYPSVGGSIILSSLFEMPDAIDYFKLRGSWARIGSAIVPPYAVNRSFSFEAGGFEGHSVQNLSGIPNPDLRPLEKTSTEVGFNLQLLDSRLTLDLSLYSDITRDDIVNTEIARSSGYSTTRVNAGKLSNKGVEFMIHGFPVQKLSGFNWDLSYNISYNKSKVERLAEGLEEISIGTSRGHERIVHHVGEPYGMVYGNVYKRNENGEIVFNRNSGLPVAVEKPIGRGVAPLTMGLSNSFSYNNFSLDILLDAKFGSVLFSETEWYAYRVGLPKETLKGRENGLHLSGVDQQGQPFEETIPQDQLRSEFYNNNDYAGRFVHNNSFVKLREITLTYDLSKVFSDFKYLQSASISIVGSNLLNIYDPMPDIDPEASNVSGNAQGIAGLGLPHTRSFGFNISLDF